MRRSWLIRAIAVLGLLGMQIGFMPLAHAEPATFNDPNMKIVWERTDKPVEMFVTARSYMWGPNTLPGSPNQEPYANSPGGMRTVQYFDKSRMEVNNPNGDRSNLFFITNGLLVREMVSGQLQLGDAVFQPRPSALEAVAGDPATVNPDSPTYTTFKPIASLNNDNPVPQKSGFVNQEIDKTGVITIWVNPSPSPEPSVVYAFYDTNLHHNIANVFVDFLNQTGPVWLNGQIVQDTVINGVFLAGLPITEPYWTKAKVGGVEKDVLVQLFERRVLTYTPSNPSGFKVEMGNVGQHYLRWRYGTNGMLSEQRIIFQSNRGTSGVQIYSMKTDGTDVKQLTTEGSNLWPRWSPDNRIAFISDRVDGEQVWVMNYDGTNQQKITSGGSQKVEPEWSADGSRIYYVESNFTTMEDQIFSIAGDGTDVKQLTNIANTSNRSPRASPDGKKVAFSSHNNNFTNAEVFIMNPDGSNETDISQNATNFDTPTDWKGNTILFQVVDNVASTQQIWSMNPDGTNKVKISGDADAEGAFSPDSQHIAFTRESGASFDIYVMKADGSGATNLTNTTNVSNRLPDWSN